MNWARRVLVQMESIDKQLEEGAPMNTLLDLSVGLDTLRDNLMSSIQKRLSNVERLVHSNQIKREHIDGLLTKGVTSAIRKD